MTGLPTAPGKDAVTALVFHTDAPFTAQARNRQRDDQQAVEQHSVGTAVEFCGRADGLPAARRAAGLDGGRAGLLAHGQLQHGPGGVLAQVCGGHARHAGWDAILTASIRRARLTRTSRFGRGMERRGRHHSLDLVAADRRHQRDRAELGGDGEVSRRHRGGQSRWTCGRTSREFRLATGFRPRARPIRR